jgi:hypothetical protein
VTLAFLLGLLRRIREFLWEQPDSHTASRGPSELARELRLGSPSRTEFFSFAMDHAREILHDLREELIVLKPRMCDGSRLCFRNTHLRSLLATFARKEVVSFFKGLINDPALHRGDVHIHYDCG